MIEGISWPSLGIAGASIGILLTMLVWLIKRQSSGAWMTTEAHNAELVRIEAEKQRAIVEAQAERDRAVTAANLVAAERKAAYDALVVTHSATVETLKQSTDANRYLDIILRNAATTPKAGDNVPREGVAKT